MYLRLALLASAELNKYWYSPPFYVGIYFCPLFRLNNCAPRCPFCVLLLGNLSIHKINIKAACVPHYSCYQYCRVTTSNPGSFPVTLSIIFDVCRPVTFYPRHSDISHRLLAIHFSSKEAQ